MNLKERIEQLAERLPDEAKAAICGSLMSEVDPSMDVCNAFWRACGEFVAGELVCRGQDMYPE